MSSFFPKSLKGRLYITLILSFIGIGLFGSLLFIQTSQRYQHHVTQIMNKELADHVAKHYTLSDNNTLDLKKIKQVFHELMILGPNYEFYILDTHGKIITFSAEKNKVVRKQVALDPIVQFINEGSLKRSIYGDNPRSESGKKVFSAAPIYVNDRPIGYMYVILGSEIYDTIAKGNIENYVIKTGIFILGVGLLVSFFATMIATGFIVRPLNRLNKQIDQVKQSGFNQQDLEDKALTAAFEQWQDHSENEIHQLGHSFYVALNKLEEQYRKIVDIDELRQELLSHISHDLRTPLASMLGYLETWELNKASLSKEESEHYIHIAKSNAKKISTLIEQLFELAHLDSGNVELKFERFSIAELVQDVLTKFSLDAEKKHIFLSVTPQDSSIAVYGDIEKLERVFTNLVSNAIRHTPENGSVTVRLSKSSRFVSVEVSDTGIGIPDEDIPHIFDPHYKAGNSVRENTAHGGLGLAITRKLLSLHQSPIEVSSRLTHGTTFRFNLSV